MARRTILIAVALAGTLAHAEDTVFMSPGMAVDAGHFLECSIHNASADAIGNVAIQQVTSENGDAETLDILAEIPANNGAWRGKQNFSMKVAHCRFSFTGSCDDILTSACSRSVVAGDTTSRACLPGQLMHCGQSKLLETGVVQGQRFVETKCAVTNHGSAAVQAFAALIDDDGATVAADVLAIAPGQTETLRYRPFILESLRCQAISVTPGGTLTSRIFNTGFGGESLDGSEGRPTE